MDYMYRDLVELARTGDHGSMETLIKRLYPLIISVVRRYGWGLDREDMIQEASMAIIEGVSLYDAARGVPFLAFIKLRLRFHVYNLSRKYRLTYSLNNTPIEEDGGGSYLELIEDEQAQIERDILNREEIMLLDGAVRSLSAQQQQVILLYYYKEMKLKEIALHMKVSYKTVCRLKERALGELSKIICR